MDSKRAAKYLMVVALGATLAGAQTRKEFRYNVGPGASVSIFNEYGPITVHPGSGNQVMVTATLRSNKVEIDNHQGGNRIELQTHLLQGANQDNGKVDYEVYVPQDSAITIRLATGPLFVERLRGDVAVEGAAASIEIHDVRDAHVHIKTLSGPVSLTNIRNGHVEITSVSGDILLNLVSGPLLSVNSTSGRIRYTGDFGLGGRYTLSSHSGDIEAYIPADASVDVTATSVKGQVDNDFPLRPKTHISIPVVTGRSLFGTSGSAASSVSLRSFSGTIRLKKRP